MATETIAGALGELRAASTAAGGTALGTTAVFIQLPLNTSHAIIVPRNFSTAVVAQIAFNPWLWVFKTQDNLLTPPIDYSEAAQDGSTATSVILSDQSTLVAGDYLLVGSHLPFRGVAIDVDAANAGSNTALTVTAWDGSGLTSLSATDGTSSASKSMAVDGNVTWTVPAWWKEESIEIICQRMGIPLTNQPFTGRREKLYWTRWVFSVVLDDAVTLDSMLAMNRSTAYAELVTGQTLEQRISRGPMGLGCIEALVNAGTANLIVNVASLHGHF